MFLQIMLDCIPDSTYLTLLSFYLSYTFYDPGTDDPVLAFIVLSPAVYIYTFDCLQDQQLCGTIRDPVGNIDIDIVEDQQGLT
jgi:hypothetical protein